MGTQDNAGLSSRFRDAYQNFNGQNWQAVRDMLDDDVVLTTLDSSTTIINKGHVTEYLKNKIGKDHPSLNQVQANADFTTGIVSGTAFWQDNDSGQRTNRRITFKFVFSWHDVDKDWFVLSLSGSPD